MPDILKVIILGIVEGITEFLPISSTGHLIVAAALLQFDPRLEETFVIFIQFGAVVAVVAYYWRDLWTQVRTVRSDRRVQRLWLALIIATLPAAALGFLLREFVREVLFSPVTVAVSLIVGGILLIVIERRPGAQPAAVTPDDADALYTVTPKQALTVGAAQTIALIPGVSRSASSILGGMFAGMSRSLATRFSFYLAIPTLGGATLADLVLSLDELQSGDFVYLIVGAVVAGITAWFAIRWLLRYVATHSFVPFGIYRIIAGVIVLALAAAGVLAR